MAGCRHAEQGNFANWEKNCFKKKNNFLIYKSILNEKGDSYGNQFPHMPSVK